MKLTIEDWQIDVAARTACRAGVTNRLSPRAMRLLQILAEARGATMSRTDLLDRVWPNVTVGDESLTQVVSEIRRTLGNKGLIATVSRGGYRLTVPVAEVAAAPANHARRPDPCFTDLEAHAICLEARDELVRCGPGAIERAEALTAQAVDLAPDSAEVQSERAIALVRSHLYWSGGRPLLGAALAHAERAAALDPCSASAQSCLGYAYAAGEHWAAADIAHRRALALAPDSASCYHLAAWYLMSCRKLRPAIAFFERVGDLEPANIKGYLHAAQLSTLFDPARARRNAQRALRRARNRLDTDPTDMRALAATALVMALLGETASAYATIETIDTSGSAQAAYLASALALVGESDRALLQIEELFDHGWRDMFWLYVDPSFERIADHRRFRAVARGLRAA